MKANVYFSEAHYPILKKKTGMPKMGYFFGDYFDYLKVNWIIF